MRTLFIIGNGFDRNLNLKTSYSEFYSFYLKKESENEKIDNLKKSIKSSIKTWADLEVAFGEYTKHMNSVSDFDEIFSDIQNNLAEYLQNIENEFTPSKIDKLRLFNHFSFPEKMLIKRYENEINSFKKKWKDHQWNVNVITLNYTRILEKILDFSGKQISLGNHDNSSILLRTINHIHGYTDNRMILGVNDKSQIGNEKFREEIDITDTLIKDNCNVAQGHTLEVSCKDLVKNANLICIFGSSLGKTDKLWWSLILQRLEHEDCRLIIFNITNRNTSELRPQYLRRVERDKIKDFLDENNINSDKRESIENRIYYALNTKMFKLNKE